MKLGEGKDQRGRSPNPNIFEVPISDSEDLPPGSGGMETGRASGPSAITPFWALGDLPSATTCPVIAPGCALGDLPSATTYRVTEEENESIGNGNGKGEETGALEEERSVSDLHGPLEMRWRSPG